MQVQAQEFGAIFLATQIEKRAGGVLVVQTIQVINFAPAIQVGNGFNIEYQYVHPCSSLA